MIDYVILRALLDRGHYQATINSIPAGMVDSNTMTLLHWYGVYFNKYDDDAIKPEVFGSMLRTRYIDKTDLLESIIETYSNAMIADIPDQVISDVTNQIEELAFSGKLGKLLSDYNSGEDIDLTFEVGALATKTRERMQVLGAKKWADGDILEYLEADADNSGLQFTTFSVLSETLKGLHAGHNVALGAPTDKGKTSLLCRMAVDFSKQAKEMPEYKDSCILFLVNEGLAETITPRLYCTALNITRDEALARAREGVLVKQYEEVVGKRDAIRLVNIHGMTIAQVQRVIEAHKPYMVITDMTGRIRASNNTRGMNELQELEFVWNSMRELAAVMHFIHIGTIQVSAEGMDSLYPPLTALQWSKVGIQTTLDLIIMMGAMLQPQEGMEDIRGISTPKNKLPRTGCRAENKFEVVFEAEKNNWIDGV